MRTLFLAVLLLLPTVAQAHAPRAGRGDLIHACVAADGSVRLVGAKKVDVCLSGEVPQHWVRDVMEEPANYATTIPWTRPDDPHPVPINPYSVTPLGDSAINNFCTGKPVSTLVEDPALTREIQTSGNPVVMSFTAKHSRLPMTYEDVLLYPANHGQIFVTDVFRTVLNRTVGQVVFSKVFIVPAGLHRFGVMVPCDPDARAGLGVRWLDVYELR